MARPSGYLTANNVATAWGVATRSAVARFPEAQYPTSALAAASGLGWGAGGMTGAAVVGTAMVVVVVGAGGIVAIVVDPATVVVVGCVVGSAAVDVPHAAAVTPRKATTAATRTGRVRADFTTPLWQIPRGNFGRAPAFSGVRAS
jgi:hypothetical protein